MFSDDDVGASMFSLDFFDAPRCVAVIDIEKVCAAR
jgi:hypothetical protein